MSQNPRPNSSMASVWDTLNKMKQRQKAAESISRQHKRFDTAKKDAIMLFERQIDLAVSNNLTDGCAALRQMRQVMDADENVRAVIDNHKERLKSTDVRHELSALRDLLHDTSNVLSVAGTCITKAQRIAQPLR